MNAHLEIGSADDPLGLATIIMASLPPTLLTDASPERYTVEVDFTRPPLPDESRRLTGEGTKSLLSKRGYPRVFVAVSGRHLQICDTSLEELRDGLAAVLAECVSSATTSARIELRAESARARARAERERSRQEAVEVLAASVHFDPAPLRPRSRDSSSGDRAQIATWAYEGGAARG